MRTILQWVSSRWRAGSGGGHLLVPPRRRGAELKNRKRRGHTIYGTIMGTGGRSHARPPEKREWIIHPGGGGQEWACIACGKIEGLLAGAPALGDPCRVVFHSRIPGVSLVPRSIPGYCPASHSGCCRSGLINRIGIESGEESLHSRAEAPRRGEGLSSGFPYFPLTPQSLVCYQQPGHI